MGMRRVGAVLLATVVVAATVVATPASAAGEEPRYRPPVDAPVVDPFRPPASTYGSGNRGLTYDLPPGTEVRASAAGEVVFAGSVGGTLHVTVLHGDGLRTSYSFLEAVRVRRGQTVEQGDVVGVGGVGFHLGVRDGAAYLDPAALFGGTEIRVRLVPHEEPLPPTDAGLLRERLALVEVVDHRNALQRLAGAAADAVRWGYGKMRAGHHIYSQLSPMDAVLDAFETLWANRSVECTSSGTAPPADADADGRIAVLVAGYGSDSVRAGIDGLHTDDLGYRPGDVLRYSYAGGRIPDPDGILDAALVGIPARPYDAPHTFTDLEAEGVALADLIEDVVAARPGVPVDVYAHSQGGVVLRVALLVLADRPGGLAALGSVVTIGTPHDGADLATVAEILEDHEFDAIDDFVRRVGADIDPRATSTGQLSETSDLIRRLQAEGVPDGVRFRTVGARGDMVVTGDKTSVDGHPSAMLDLFGPAVHHDLPASAGTTRELALALAGMAPTCRGWGDKVQDATIPEIIGFTENAFGAGFSLG